MPDIRSLNLPMLRVLDSLLQERNVTKTAARLGLTQPAVSGLLARLRRSFGDPLFVRTARGVIPTSRAIELGPAVRQVLADIETLLHARTFNPASADFTLALTASDYVLNVLASPFLTALRAQAPGVRAIVRALSASVYDDLESGHTDVAILVMPVERPLRGRELFRDSFVCVMREGHPAASRELSLDLFCSLDHALVAPDGSFEGRTDEALSAVGRRRRVAFSVSSFLVLPSVLRTTDLISVIPARLASQTTGLVTRRPPLPVAGFSAFAYWHESSDSDPARSWARALLFEACDRLSPDRSLAAKIVRPRDGGPVSPSR